MRHVPTDQPPARPPQRVPMLLSRKNAAFEAGVSTRTIDRLIACGVLHPRHIGRRVLIDYQELLTKVINQHHVTISKERKNGAA